MQHKTLFRVLIVSLFSLVLLAALPAAAQESTPEAPSPEATPEPEREPICLEFTDSPVDVRTSYYMGEGAAYFSTGDYSRAIFAFTCVIEEIDEDYTPAYINRAITQVRVRNLEAALADYDRVLELEPQNIAAVNNRGIVRMARGEYDEALADFNRTLELEDNYILGLNNRAVLYAVRGEYENAIADAERLIEATGIDEVYDALLDPEVEDITEYDRRAARGYALLGIIYSYYSLDNYRRYLTLAGGSTDGRIQAAAGALESRFTFEIRLDDGSWLLEASFED
ncbi:MAG: tetratricopeptide repeat protein [bacterium]|nr:tetratricopeptide repeat protein [bacterium]